MISLEEAQRFVLDQCQPLSPVLLPLDEARNLVVSTPLVATEPVPPFTNSSMDGYAVRAIDTVGAPVRLLVVGSIMAGHPLDESVGAGQAARIMTGAPVPAGADAVCMIEETAVDIDGDGVVIGRELQRGDYVRDPGCDVAVGDLIATAGATLTPAHLGVLASQGVTEVSVHPRPRVGVLSTGDELSLEDGPLAPGKIRDANRHTLLALGRGEGWDCIDLGIVGDDEATLVEVLAHGAETCDVLVTSGGVSVGDLDLIRVVLEKMSAGGMRWMQVAIKPAKPFAFGMLGNSLTPVFGLPGNPVSAMVSFELFVRPALRRLGGHAALHRPVVTATAEVDIDRKADGKLHLLRALMTIDRRGDLQVRPTEGQASHQLKSMSEANALILLPDGNGAREGDQVNVLLIDAERLTVDNHRALAWPGDEGASS